jgi:hypothetical protein
MPRSLLAEVLSYVVEKRSDPILLAGEVVIGARLPEFVALQSIPDHGYQFRRR